MHTWILFVVIFNTGMTDGVPTMATQHFSSLESCEKAKTAILQSLILPTYADAKAVCVEDKPGKKL